ncbi:flavin reductase [Rhodobacteraceae bacterium]|nr:flavin reductase [Paracoccaceae bacterium]
MINPVRNSDFDPKAFRRALGNFATGVTIITAEGVGGEKVGVTASSFNSLSMDPPLILWSCIKDARSCEIFESASHFAVNILASDQMDMSNHFAQQQEDKFAGFAWDKGLGGAPIFPNCAGRFQCETYDKLDGGDHWIFVGKVIVFDDFGRAPLCFHQGSYSMVFSHPGVGPKPNADVEDMPSDGRMGNHKFFMMLRAIRAYQDRYQPKITALDVNLIESRSLLVISDIAGLNAEKLAVHVNAPLEEVEEALMNLTYRGMVDNRGKELLLTNVGQAKANECWEIASAHAEAAFGEFSDEQIESFTSVLKGLL